MDRITHTARGKPRVFKTFDAVVSFVRLHFSPGRDLHLCHQVLREPWRDDARVPLYPGSDKQVRRAALLHLVPPRKKKPQFGDDLGG